MIELLAPLEMVEYTSKHDPGPEKTVFRLRGLSAREKTLAESRTMRAAREDRDAMLYEQVVRLGLRGWDKGPRPFDPEDMDANLDALPQLIYIELGLKLMELSNFELEDKKKSGSRCGSNRRK